MATWRWNVFDCIITSLQLVDVVMRPLINTESGRNAPLVTHIFYVVTLARVARALRIVHMLKDLRVLCHSILESMRPLGWTVLLLALITFMFSIFLTMVVTHYRFAVLGSELDEKGFKREEDESLTRYYGSIERSTLALYEMISDGIHWGELVEPLRQISPWLELIFAAYVALTVLAMMNIVMGIFVDSIMRTTESTKKRLLIHQMKRLFDESDADGSGSIDWEEFEAQLSNPGMQAYLKEIDLDEQGARDLFNLLDVEDKEEVSAEDFVSGCSRLSGAAKAMDLAVFQHEQRMFQARFDKHADLIERSLSWQTDNLATILEKSVETMDVMKSQPANAWHYTSHSSSHPEPVKQEKSMGSKGTMPIRLRRASCDSAAVDEE